MSDAFTVIDIETTGNLPWRDKLVAVGIGGTVWKPEEGRAMAALLLQREVTVVAHTNYDLRWLLLDGLVLGERVTFHDTKVMAWLLDGTQELALDALASRYLGYVPPKPIRRQSGRIMFEAEGGLMPIEDVPWDEMVAYNKSDIDTEAELYVCLRTLMQEKGLWEHFVTEEAPFSRLLVEMEQNGMPFDAARAADLREMKMMEAVALEQRLVESTGALTFNPGSVPQVKSFLYSDLWKAEVKFPIPRLAGMSAEDKTAAIRKITPEGVHVTRVGREYAYGHQVLEGMGLKPITKKDPKTRQLKTTVSAKLLTVAYGDNPWVQDYAEWRKLTKLIGYLNDWLAREHNGRLHGRFDQSGTITGRLAGREPNLQQVASESGVRDLFRGDLVVGDYGGLEARIAASMSGDPVMLDVFRSGKDLYGTLAARAWGGEESKDNPGRGLMKVVWLASQYGAQGETLAETMAVAGLRGYTAAKADKLLRDMMDTVPRLFLWRDEVIREAAVLGYVTTVGGRRRHLADIGSADWAKNARAERQAVNSKVQGSAADIVRRAMLVIRRAIHPAQARICLQVHDEILLERGSQWNDDLFYEIVDICENGTGFSLDVPLVFEAKIAESWAAKGGAPGQVSSGAYDHLNEQLEGAAA